MVCFVTVHREGVNGLDVFMRLYDRYFDDIYRFVLFRVGNRWDTDDLVSDIFRKVLEQMVRQGGVSLEYERAWLFTIAQNRIIDHYRKKTEKTFYGTNPEHGGYDQIPDMFNTAAVHNDCLQEALMQLEHEEREMVHLKYMIGFAYREISQVMGRTESWLRNRIHRIKKKMAVELKQCMEEV